MRYQKLFVLVTSLLSATLLPAYATPSCQTKETCAVGTECSCTITPSSAYERYFYWNFPGILKGVNYSCHFSDTVNMPVLDSFKLPAGVQHQVSGSYPHFPMQLKLQTDAMQDKQGNAEIKIFIPASDYPTTVTMACMAKNP